MIPLPRDFQDFLKLLNAGRVRYVVIGGYAVAYHGYVRYTGDLDIFVEMSDANATKLHESGLCCGGRRAKVESMKRATAGLTDVDRVHRILLRLRGARGLDEDELLQ